jgi:hypothetical protein
MHHTHAHAYSPVDRCACVAIAFIAFIACAIVFARSRRCALGVSITRTVGTRVDGLTVVTISGEAMQTRTFTLPWTHFRACGILVTGARLLGAGINFGTRLSITHITRSTCALRLTRGSFDAQGARIARAAIRCAGIDFSTGLSRAFKALLALAAILARP